MYWFQWLIFIFCVTADLLWLNMLELLKELKMIRVKKNTKEKGELGKWGGEKTQSKRTGKMLFALGNRTGDRAVVT